VAAHLLHVPPRSRASVVATMREAARRASDEGGRGRRQVLSRACAGRASGRVPAGRRPVRARLGRAALRRARRDRSSRGGIRARARAAALRRSCAGARQRPLHRRR
jgi:hypothetical protein